MTVHDSSDSNFKTSVASFLLGEMIFNIRYQTKTFVFYSLSLLRLASHYPVSPQNTPYRVKNVYCGDSEYWQAYAQNEKGSLGLTDYHIAFTEWFEDAGGTHLQGFR